MRGPERTKSGNDRQQWVVGSCHAFFHIVAILNLMKTLVFILCLGLFQVAYADAASFGHCTD